MVSFILSPVKDAPQTAVFVRVPSTLALKNRPPSCNVLSPARSLYSCKPFGKRFNMVKKILLAFAVLFVLGSWAAASTLADVKKRGLLVCGSNPGLAGFGLPDGQGHWAGFDVDFCRAIAA